LPFELAAQAPTSQTIKEAQTNKTVKI